MQNNLNDMAIRIAVEFVPFLFALCFHEYAHGWVARRRGDNTAEMMGRLTMNPLVHMDMVGTLILPLMAIMMPGSGMFFGWAKPVPVNERNLKNPRSDMFWIALAGPASNLLLALLSTVIIFILARTLMASQYYRPSVSLLEHFIVINLMLAVFNALPLHPLDGGKILARFLPHKTNLWLEERAHISGMVLLALFLFGGLHYLSIPIQYLFSTLMTMAGT